LDAYSYCFFGVEKGSCAGNAENAKESRKAAKEAVKQKKLVLDAGVDVSNGSFQKESRKQDFTGAFQLAVFLFFLFFYSLKIPSAVLPDGYRPDGYRERYLCESRENPFGSYERFGITERFRFLRKSP